MKIAFKEENQYTKLLEQYQRRVVTREDFYMTLYMTTLKDHQALDDMKIKSDPEKPIEYKMAEQRMYELTKNLEIEEKKKKQKDFYKWVKENFKPYFESVSQVRSKNLSNKMFLIEMLLFLKGKHDLLAEKVQKMLVPFENIN